MQAAMSASLPFRPGCIVSSWTVKVGLVALPAGFDDSMSSFDFWLSSDSPAVISLGNTPGAIVWPDIVSIVDSAKDHGSCPDASKQITGKGNGLFENSTRLALHIRMTLFSKAVGVRCRWLDAKETTYVNADLDVD